MPSPGKYQIHTWVFPGWDNEFMPGIGKPSGLLEQEGPIFSLDNYLIVYRDQLQQHFARSLRAGAPHARLAHHNTRGAGGAVPPVGARQGHRRRDRWWDVA